MADDFRVLETIPMYGEQCKHCGKVARFHEPEAFDGWEMEHRKMCPAVVRP